MRQRDRGDREARDTVTYETNKTETHKGCQSNHGVDMMSSDFDRHLLVMLSQDFDDHEARAQYKDCHKQCDQWQNRESDQNHRPRVVNNSSKGVLM